MNKPNTKINALDEYEEAFRELVNDRVWMGSKSPSDLLRLNNENEWPFVCVAMDIVGDASSALHNFIQFGLNGPTKYEDTGERYLRLYGLLSAAYSQQQAVLKLYQLMNCPSPKKAKERLEKLSIRILRHQLASHSLDYKDDSGKVSGAFVPVRIYLSGYKFSVTENRGDSSVSYDLLESITEHCSALIELMDQIYQKSYRTLFKGHQKHLKAYHERSEELRSIANGAIIIKIPSTPESDISRVIIIPHE